MGSRNSDGTVKLLTENLLAVRHRGNFLTKANTRDDLRGADVPNSGTISRKNIVIVGVAWQQGAQPEGASTSGLPGTPGTSSAAFADNSVERAKFTANGEEAGNLQHHVTRKDGIFASISDRQGILGHDAPTASGLAGGDAVGPMQTITERKVFFLDEDRGKDRTDTFADWTIFDSTGKAVGADAGTTDTDKTPNEGLLGKPDEC